MNTLEDDKVLEFDSFVVNTWTQNQPKLFIQVLVQQLIKAGWEKFKEVDPNTIHDEDIKKAFDKMDMDGSGQISKRVSQNKQLKF